MLPALEKSWLEKKCLGPEKFFRCKANRVKGQISHHARAFRKELVGKKCLGPEKFFQVQAKQSSGLDIPSCQGLKVHFGVVLGSKGGGGKKKLFRSRHFFFNLGPKTLQHRQDKPTQAKGSLWGQMAFSESGWRLAEAVL